MFGTSRFLIRMSQRFETFIINRELKYLSSLKISIIWVVAFGPDKRLKNAIQNMYSSSLEIRGKCTAYEMNFMQ